MIATKERLYRSQSVKESRKEKIDDGVLILETRKFVDVKMKIENNTLNLELLNFELNSGCLSFRLSSKFWVLFKTIFLKVYPFLFILRYILARAYFDLHPTKLNFTTISVVYE